MSFFRTVLAALVCFSTFGCFPHLHKMEVEEGDLMSADYEGPTSLSELPGIQTEGAFARLVSKLVDDYDPADDPNGTKWSNIRKRIQEARDDFLETQEKMGQYRGYSGFVVNDTDEAVHCEITGPEKGQSCMAFDLAPNDSRQVTLRRGTYSCMFYVIRRPQVRLKDPVIKPVYGPGWEPFRFALVQRPRYQ